jgi:hypothetical protein
MIKVSDAINVFNTLYSLKSEKFSGKVSYAIDKNLNSLAKHIVAYESDVYKLGAEISGGIIDPESNAFKIPEERQSEYDQRILEINEKEIDFKLHRVIVTEFDKSLITPEMMGTLRNCGFITELL